MIYAVLGALAVGLSLGVFGSGGSILTVPILIYLLRHPDKAAIAESLAIVGSIALLTAVPYALGRHVRWRYALLFGLPGMAGTYVGAWLASYVPGYVQLFVFAGVMVMAAIRMWRRSSRKAAAMNDTRPTHHAAWKIALLGVGVGTLTGFVGVGGGFLIVPALVLLAGLTMRHAIATSLVIIAMQSAVGFSKHVEVIHRMGQAIDWQTIGLFIAVGVVGSLAGKRINERLPQRALQRGFAVLLIVMAGFILAKESLSLQG